MAVHVAHVDVISAGVCERLITAATAHCSTQPIISPAPAAATANPTLDQVTVSLTAMSTALSWGMFVLACLGILGLIGFVVFVRHWAKDEARRVAEDWFDNEAPAILAELAKPLNNGVGNPPNQPGGNADEIGNVVG